MWLCTCLQFDGEERTINVMCMKNFGARFPGWSDCLFAFYSDKMAAGTVAVALQLLNFQQLRIANTVVVILCSRVFFCSAAKLIFTVKCRRQCSWWQSRVLVLILILLGNNACLPPAATHDHTERHIRLGSNRENWRFSTFLSLIVQRASRRPWLGFRASHT